ncbi:uncharacterized protein PFL1_04634 [Pseudozyma flocculosa PF-1]|uniref:Uncharacterized protein n=2 Tax=Pseudozyma flocculosa TaxID=84751 RepID=A0A5C3FDW7_9BASI|nr:uncharacterized protein PFL1_04634 [Pseudozyma flocculosa PF-1]EPQ27890.1 hypothetical protein PFL1_04634 [Pseudozyma flocculosa PF-1]SPO41671.1 uncharacterized protein PSFLO_07153 [Pseudozyma flocculosa]
MQSQPHTPAPALSAASIYTTSAAQQPASTSFSHVPAPPKATAPPPQFYPIAPSIYVSRPTDKERASQLTDIAEPLRPLDAALATSPRDVVIFGWMDAPLRLVAKYAVPYTVLFPQANVYIKLSNGKSYLSSEARRKRDLEPLVDHVCRDVAQADRDASSAPAELSTELGDSTVTLLDTSQTLADAAANADKPSSSPSQHGGLVIHSFSDGGAGNLALFLSMLPRTSSAPRVHSLIMDSSPGKSTPASGASAFTMPLAHRPALRAVVRFFVYLGLYLLKIWTRLKGQPTRAEKMRSTLNALHTWTWVTASRNTTVEAAAAAKAGAAAADEVQVPPRMYLYSKSDKLIPWRYVEEHAHHLAHSSRPGSSPRLVEMQSADAKSALASCDSGPMAVELRRWDDAPHCGIVRSDFKGYWSAVVQFHTAVLSSQASSTATGQA